METHIFEYDDKSFVYLCWRIRVDVANANRLKKTEDASAPPINSVEGTDMTNGREQI